MKKILLFLGILAFAFLVTPATAQHFDLHHTCGLTGEDAAAVKERMMQNREEMRDYAHQRGVITYIPIKVHLIANDAGEGRLIESSALTMVCILNEAYLQHELQFYIKDGFNYIDHTPSYNLPGSNAADLRMETQRDDNAVNIFVNSVIPNPGSVGTTLAYYTPSNDWIVITKGNVFGPNVLAHEMGHFFSLNHPFYGWENAPYDVAVHGSPLFSNFSPTFPTIQNERQNQSNCMIAADGICDTPPDYLFGFVNNNNCNEYTGGATDFLGEVVDPMENNMMSYFDNCTQYEFTPDQVDAMLMDLGSSARNYLDNGSTSTDELAGAPDLGYPVNASTVAYTSVTFHWEAIAGATHYLLEVDRLSSFSFDPKYYITTDPGKTLTDLQVNLEYFWRVRPFSALRTCPLYSDIHSFTTADMPVNTTEIKSVENWLVRPNPVAKNTNVVIEMNTNEAFDAEVKVFSLTGQLISSNNNTFAQGASTFEVNTNDLNTGMYIISVQSAKGVMTQKVVVR